MVERQLAHIATFTQIPFIQTDDLLGIFALALVTRHDEVKFNRGRQGATGENEQAKSGDYFHATRLRRNEIRSQTDFQHIIRIGLDSRHLAIPWRSLHLWYTVVRSSMRIEWDAQKERINIKKHGVSFSDAEEAITCKTVIVLKEDLRHNEQRFVFMGICKRMNILVVVIAYPEDSVTRIISARKTTRSERTFYEAQL